jgi:hypothetical protein
MLEINFGGNTLLNSSTVNRVKFHVPIGLTTKKEKKE